MIFMERVRIPITTTISSTYKKWLDEKHIPVSTALARGIKSLQEREEGKGEEIGKLRGNIDKLQGLVKQLYSRIDELEKKQIMMQPNLSWNDPKKDCYYEFEG